MSLDLEAAEWRVKLEWPQEVVGLLELWSAGNNLVNKVLDTVNSDFAELTGNDSIVGQRNAASVYFTTSSLVDKLGNVLFGWISVRNIWLNNLNHVQSGFVEFDEHTVVKLSQSQKLQDFLWLGSELVDTKQKSKINYCSHTKKNLGWRHDNL